MRQDLLLHSDEARALYRQVAGLPLIDWHNHLSIADLRNDRKFRTITELWVASDPYKHRAMRICGVPEKCISGDASDFDKFAAWWRTLPMLAGNPLYFWSVMELEKVFGVTESPGESSARAMYDLLNEKLAGDGFSARGILEKFNVEYAAPCAGLADDLSQFDGLPGIVPSFRGDDALKLNFPADCGAATLAELRTYLAGRVTELHEHGCRFADHALDGDFTYVPDDGGNDARFAAWRRGELVPGFESDWLCLQSEILRTLAGEYARRGWVLQLHIGALRRTSDRLRVAAGPTGGYASFAGACDMETLVTLLNDLEKSAAGMPRVILYTLNPVNHAAFANLSGSFTGDGVRGQVRLGPAWWYCDHRSGIRDCLAKTAAFGVLSVFPGMTTDSRSLLSFVRHDYYRRVMCDFLAEQAAADELPRDMATLSELAEALAYGNAKEMIKETEE